MKVSVAIHASDSESGGGGPVTAGQLSDASLDLSDLMDGSL